MIPLASITAKVLGKRMSKISTQAQEKSGDLNRYLIDLFKNHKIIKIFQRENFENMRSEKFVNDLKEKSAKISAVYIRSSTSNGNINRYNDCYFNILFWKINY